MRYSFAKCFENPQIYEMLSSFLEQSHNLELLHFYELVKDFNLLMNQTYKEKRAKMIYERFLVEDAPEEINISGDALKKTLELYFLAEKKQILFDSSIFESSFKIVSRDLIHDAFHRFIFSQEFLEYIQEKKKVLSEKDFADVYLDDEEEEDREIYQQKKLTQAERTLELIMDQNPLQLLTSKISFYEGELDHISDEELKLNNYIMNKMIVELKKPFSGVHLSTPTLRATEKKKSVFSALLNNSKKESETKQEINKLRKFTKKSLQKWLEKYFDIAVDDERLSKFIQLLVKYNVIQSMTQYEDYNLTDYFCFSPKKKTVVIIGSGYGGITAANELKKDFDVICIDKQRDFSFRNSYYTLFSNPMKISQLEYSMADLVDGWKYINGNVQHISPTAVFLQDDSIIPFDYLIVASGAHYFVPYEITQQPFAPRYPGDRYDQEQEQLEPCNIRIIIPYNASNIISNYPYIRKAKKIVVLGAGAVALEACGEIASTYPKCKITMITQSSSLLDKYQSEKISSTAQKILMDYKNVEILYQKGIVRVEGRKIFYKDISDQKKHNLLESIEADALVNGLGLRPTTQFFKPFMNASLNAKGFVQVNDYLQVKRDQSIVEGIKSPDAVFSPRESDILNRLNSMTFFKKTSDPIIKKPSDDSISFKPSKETLSPSSASDSSEKQSIDESESTLTNVMELLSGDVDQNIQELIDNSFENIYAIGDIVDLTKVEKLAFHAMEHAKRVAHNIKLSESCENINDFKKKATKYKIDESVVQSIALGKRGIIIQGKKVVQQGLTNKYKEDVQTKQLEDFILRCQRCQFKFGDYCEFEKEKK